MPVSCTNNLDGTIWNMCMRDTSEGLLWILGAWSETVIHHPFIVTEAFLVLTVALPFFALDMTRKVTYASASYKRYNMMRFRLANLIHRLGFVFVLGNGLKCVFRQFRPCFCNGKEYGDMYGMPSQDAMMGGLLAAWMWDAYNPMWKWRKRLFGVIVMLMIAYQRPIVGMHTFGQVLAGSALGWAIHFYSTRLPQYMVFFNDLGQIIFAVIAILLDPALKHPVTKEDYMGFTFQGVSLQLFALALLWRHHERSWSSLKASLHATLSEQETGHAYLEIADDTEVDVVDLDGRRDDAGNAKRWFKMVDGYGLLTGICLFVFTRLFASIVSTWRIFGVR